MHLVGHLLSLGIFLAAALVLSLPVLAGDEQVPPTGAAACPADADLSGLLDHLTDMSHRLTGLDALAAADAAEALLARQVEREGLCTALEARGRQIEALRGSLALRDGLLAGCRADREACWQDATAMLARPRAPGRAALGWSVGAGACVGSDGAVSVCAAAVFGYRF